MKTYEMLAFEEALFFYLKDEIERVYWNKNQEVWDGYQDPEIPGITWFPFYWGDIETLVSRPNFSFEDVEISWYKYVGRGMRCNKDWRPYQWRDWFYRCLDAICKTEVVME